MPKIIENLEQKLLAETARQICDGGYNGVTIRSVAKACGIALGTVYNYFPSKDHLIVSCMLETWNNCLVTIDESTQESSPRSVTHCIYTQLLHFINQYRPLFRDKSAIAIFVSSFHKYHVLLREQLAKPLRKFCDNDFSAEFAAEALLTWTMNEKTFEEIYFVLEKIWKEE